MEIVATVGLLPKAFGFLATASMRIGLKINILYIIYILKFLAVINMECWNIDLMMVILMLVVMMDRWRGWGPWRRTMTLIGSNYVLFSVDLLNFLFMGEPRLHARVPTGHLGRWTGPVVHKSNFLGSMKRGKIKSSGFKFVFLRIPIFLC